MNKRNLHIHTYLCILPTINFDSLSLYIFLIALLLQNNFYSFANCMPQMAHVWVSNCMQRNKKICMHLPTYMLIANT